MPKIKFQNRENTPRCVDPGEYIYEVAGYEFKISPSSGNDYAQLKLRNVQTGSYCYDNLVFVGAAEWRIDTFLRSFNIAPAVGAEIEFNKEFCERKALGARGWISVSKVEKEKNGNRTGIFKNEVISYLTNKGAVARAEKPATPPEAPKPEAQPAADEKADW